MTDASGLKRVDPAEVHAKARRLLADPVCRENARRVSEKLRTHGGARLAAELIEESV